LTKLLLFGRKLNYSCSKVDDEVDDDNKYDDYIDYDYYGSSDDDDSDDDDATCHYTWLQFGINITVCCKTYYQLFFKSVIILIVKYCNPKPVVAGAGFEVRMEVTMNFKDFRHMTARKLVRKLEPYFCKPQKQ
jgi:hypothetical protein